MVCVNPGKFGESPMSDRLNKSGRVGTRTGIVPRIQESIERAKELPLPPTSLPEFDDDSVTGIITNVRPEGEDVAKQADDDPIASAAG